MTADFDILHNISIWAALSAWMFAQFLKLLFSTIKTKKIDFHVFVRLGGMPSSHSAMASALATSVGLCVGFSTPLFALTLAFSGIIMFDAQSVRRAAGTQARLLNQIVEEFFKEKHVSEKKLVEFLGHTPLEVFLGMALGIAMALIIHTYWPL
ncbi:MAG: divergent PAP2 family protein [Kiritimatiellae bacterium]|nr:divergent PAP2 family protein [Kiritimatiellia bacterium]